MPDYKQQMTARVGTQLSSPGNYESPSLSRMSELLTVNWKENLVLEGRVWSVTVGTLAAGGDVSGVTGGGAGTVIDQDQPEIAIGVDAGYFLIPIEIRVGALVDMDADGEKGDIAATVDRSAGVPTSVTGTIETPENQLDGGGTFPGRAFSAITADITDPTVDEVLDYEHIQGSDNGTAGNLAVTHLKMLYQPAAPNLIKGPCGLYVYWGGTAAVTALARVVVAAVPLERFIAT